MFHNLRTVYKDFLSQQLTLMSICVSNFLSGDVSKRKFCSKAFESKQNYAKTKKRKISENFACDCFLCKWGSVSFFEDNDAGWYYLVCLGFYFSNTTKERVCRVIVPWICRKSFRTRF